jgi:hypothetical protein
MKTSMRQKLIDTILLYSDDSNPISPQKLNQMAAASKLELVQILINDMNSRIKPFKLKPYNP